MSSYHYVILAHEKESEDNPCEVIPPGLEKNGEALPEKGKE
jgi:hypothetical protein